MVQPSNIDPTTVQITTASTSVIAGNEGQLNIRVQDVFGNYMCTSNELCSVPAAPTLVLLQATGDRGFGVPSFNGGQSVFQYTFIVTVAGEYEISVSVNEQPVVFKPKPYLQVLPGEADAGAFLVNLQSIYMAGTISFLLHARDQYLNNITIGGESIQVGKSSILAFHAMFTF